MKSNIFKKFTFFLMMFGPGLVVMLADTDAGSLVTAAQSGAVWGYQLISLQIILIPILYIIQELTIRLGITTQQGYGTLIKTHFGTSWAWVSVIALFLCCIGGIISQFSGLASIGLLFGIPAWRTMLLAVAFLILIVLSGSYRSVERCAIFLGLFEMVFVVIAVFAHPSAQELWTGLKSFPLNHSNYLYLAAANIGAVIMPWMIFYQQSAITHKNLGQQNMHLARWDTAIGAIITQVIMISVIIITAATIGKNHPGTSLQSVHQISDALIPYVGMTTGRVLFAFGLAGASMVAALVISLTAAWALGEITGYPCSLESKGCEAPHFYSVYVIILVLGALLVMSGINLVHLNIAIEVLNALLLPIVLGFLYLLARTVLPEKYRLKGIYGLIVGIILFLTAGFALISALWGIFM